ncbi:ABC transporter permease [Peptostreptococcaceae bacterium AGR-M142]|jgi:simple sugar transport system permease protein
MKDLFDLALLQNTIRTATPLILAALGGLLTMHAGILNIGMEGMILMGAFFGVLGSYFFSSSLAGVIIAIIAGMLMGALFGLFVIDLKSDEFIIGIAINIFAGGVTVFLLRSIFGVKGAFSSPDIVSLPNLNIPFFNNIEFLDKVFNNHSILVYVSWILIALIYIILYKTPYGMYIRGVGEHAQALETAGIKPRKIKYSVSILCGMLCSLAGAHLSLGYLTLFTENMSAGKGFISLAAIIFGNSNPIKVYLASLLFGFFDALGIRMQLLNVPSQFTQMIPYVATVAVLFIVAQKKLLKGTVKK